MICLLPTGQNSAAQEGRKKAEQMCGGKMLRALYCSLHWLSCPTAPPCLVVLFAPDQPLARKRRFVPQLRSGGTLTSLRPGSLGGLQDIMAPQSSHGSSDGIVPTLPARLLAMADILELPEVSSSKHLAPDLSRLASRSSSTWNRRGPGQKSKKKKKKRQSRSREAVEAALHDDNWLKAQFVKETSRYGRPPACLESKVKEVLGPKLFMKRGTQEQPSWTFMKWEDQTISPAASSAASSAPVRPLAGAARGGVQGGIMDGDTGTLAVWTEKSEKLVLATLGRLAVALRWTRLPSSAEEDENGEITLPRRWCGTFALAVKTDIEEVLAPIAREILEDSFEHLPRPPSSWHGGSPHGSSDNCCLTRHTSGGGMRWRSMLSSPWQNEDNISILEMLAALAEIRGALRGSWGPKGLNRLARRVMAVQLGLNTKSRANYRRALLRFFASLERECVPPYRHDRGFSPDCGRDFTAMAGVAFPAGQQLEAAGNASEVELRLACREVQQSLEGLARCLMCGTPSDLSLRVQRQPENPFDQLLPLMKDANNVVLCKGVPPDEYLPLNTICFTVKKWDSADDVLTVSVDAASTMLAQRYPALAWGQLKSILCEHTRSVCKPAASDWAIALSAGSMSALDIAIAMFLNPGDTILVEEFTFLAMIDACVAAGLRLVPISCDSSGLCPESLELVLGSERSAGRVPKVLYTVPVGQNPLGTRLPAHRYQAIYDLCTEHGVVILEDDAYFYQQHNAHDSLADDDGSAVGELQNLGATFVSIDHKGMVFRLESFAKMLAPGFRLGWVTGPKRFIEAYEKLCYISTQQGSSLAMVCLASLLSQWGRDGLQAQLRCLQLGLRRRCRALLRACEAHLSDLATWAKPQAGMFLWLKMTRPTSTFSSEALVESMQRHGVVAMPGSFCSPEPDSRPVVSMHCQFHASILTFSI
ncbi:Aromatic amino acid aminotransferase C56E4.03 [Symbiodinium microadriaticum]|uniref:Aromatic amino acid aminotransferase C56E4.03 n=1 Tax=Symbiodinium microadriaticum TaxID=2951 RepID=A0A1Q9DHI8_SYMMI|nr:Aromatic amino acid aminotransferase C56E4.03 [Symbiodinium microadriaticum]